MSRSNLSFLKQKAKKLRAKGKTYSEINAFLGVNIPKSTLSFWFKDLDLSEEVRIKIKKAQDLRIKFGQISAKKTKTEIRKKYLNHLLNRNKHLIELLKNKDVSKVVLASLYLGEGSKDPKRGSLVFGNSDPRIIKLFLKLLRKCYKLDELKFRCTVQCRADQNTKELELFWHKITDIPLNKFYGTRIDSRTIGQKSKKPEYRGVCRIDYFSSEVFNDILKVIEVIAGR